MAGGWGRRGIGTGIGTMLALMTASGARAVDFDAAFAETPRWSPWVEFGSYYGSDNASRGEIAGWLPLIQNGESLLFLDARGKLFEDEFFEGNVAVGGRAMLGNGWNIGVWGGYDARKSSTGNIFHQVSGGVEALGEVFDLRANGYLPINDSEELSSSSSSTGTVTLQGSNIVMITDTVTSTTSELALWGVDGEVGVKLPLTGGAGGNAPGAVLALYGGGFYYDHADLPDPVAGPKARAELRFNEIIPGLAGSRLAFEAEASWDEVRGTRWEAGARLRIPFGAPPASARDPGDQWRRMAEAIERDTDVVTETNTSETTTTAEEGVEDAMTDVALNQVVFANGTTGLGGITQGDNTLIIAEGSDPITGEQTLQGNQTLLAAGTSLSLRGVDTGTIADFTYAGDAPVFEASDFNQDLLTLAGSNSHVAGIVFDDGGRSNIDAIWGGSDKANVVIDRVDIAGTSSGIVFLFGNSDVTVTGAMLADIEAYGLSFSNNNTGVLISGTTVTRASYFNGVGSISIGAGNTVAIADTVIDGGPISTGSTNGLEIFGGGNTLTLTDVTLIGGFQGDGIRVNEAGNTLVSGGGNTAAGATFAGVFCDVTGAQTGAFEFDIGNCPGP